jgi:uncharacterized protein (TIGR04255 family)
VVDIRYCENSTISEAWALVLGRPSPLVPDEISAVVHKAKKDIEGLTIHPSVVLVASGSTGVMPPHWQQQVSWNNDARLARIGHEYLSVHFIRQASQPKYEKFNQSLAPAIEQWLKLRGETIGNERPLDRVVFGYVNIFAFPAESFDLSKYFKANVALDAAVANGGLQGFETTFRVMFGCTNEVTLAIAVDSIDESADPSIPEVHIRVVTRTVAQQALHDQTDFADSAVLEQIRVAKDRAKSLFFDFTTDETHQLMGARS